MYFEIRDENGVWEEFYNTLFDYLKPSDDGVYITIETELRTLINQYKEKINDKIV